MKLWIQRESKNGLEQRVIVLRADEGRRAMVDGRVKWGSGKPWAVVRGQVNQVCGG